MAQALLAGADVLKFVYTEYCWAITQAAGRSCWVRLNSRWMDFKFRLDEQFYAQARVLQQNSTFAGPTEM